MADWLAWFKFQSREARSFGFPQPLLFWGRGFWLIGMPVPFPAFRPANEDAS